MVSSFTSDYLIHLEFILVAGERQESNLIFFMKLPNLHINIDGIIYYPFVGFFLIY